MCSGEPDPAVLRLPAGRLIAAVALVTLHTILFAKYSGFNVFDFPLAKFSISLGLI